MRILNKKKTILLVLVGTCFFIFLYNLKADIKTNSIMEATIYETPIYYLDNGVKKPKVFIISGIHGNEIAGVKASEWIIEEEYDWAKTILIPKANHEALKLNVRNPYYMSDLNRNFPGKENGTDTEKLANEIFNRIKEEKPDFVIDLHEWDNNFDEDTSLLTNGLILNSIGGRLWESAEKVYNQYIKLNKKDKLVLNIGPPIGSINREVSERLNIPVITIESNLNNSIEDRINFHLYIIENIIKNYGMD